MTGYFYISVSKFLFLCPLFTAVTILKSVSTSENECAYKGDICKIDHQKCLTEKFKENDMEECDSYFINYGTGPVYVTRKEIPFSIKIVRGREYYAKNLTYRILHNADGKFTSIADCCSVSEYDTCILPPLNNQDTESQFVFVPLAEEPDKYCYFPIYEKPVHVPWCHEILETDEVCKFFKNGKLKIKNTFEALSSANFIIDYCFFEAPSRYIKASRTSATKQNDLTFDVVGISYGDKDGEIRIGNETHSCEITKNIEKYFARHKRSTSKGACVFVRTNGDNKWDASPACKIPLLKEPENPLMSTTKWITVVYVVVVSSIVVFCVSLLLVFYRKYVKTCMIKYPEAIKELPNKDAIEDNEGQNFVENNTCKLLHLESPDLDLIVPMDLNENLDKGPENGREADKLRLFIDAKTNSWEDEKRILDNAGTVLSNWRDSGCHSDFKGRGQDEYVKKDEKTLGLCVGMNSPIWKKSDLGSGFSQYSIPSFPITSRSGSAPAFLDDVTECNCITREVDVNDRQMDFDPESIYVVKTRLIKESELDSKFSLNARYQRSSTSNYEGTVKSRLDVKFSPEAFSHSPRSSSSSSCQASKNCHQATFYGDEEQDDYACCTEHDDSRAIDSASMCKHPPARARSSSSSGHGSMDELLLSHCFKNIDQNENACIERLSLLPDYVRYTSK